MMGGALDPSPQGWHRRGGGHAFPGGLGIHIADSERGVPDGALVSPDTMPAGHLSKADLAESVRGCHVPLTCGKYFGLCLWSEETGPQDSCLRSKLALPSVMKNPTVELVIRL